MIIPRRSNTELTKACRSAYKLPEGTLTLTACVKRDCKSGNSSFNSMGAKRDENTN